MGDPALLRCGNGCGGYWLFFGCVVMPQLHTYPGGYWVFCHPFSAPSLFLWHPDLMAHGGHFLVASPSGRDAALRRALLWLGGHHARLATWVECAIYWGDGQLWVECGILMSGVTQ